MTYKSLCDYLIKGIRKLAWSWETEYLLAFSCWSDDTPEDVNIHDTCHSRRRWEHPVLPVIRQWLVRVLSDRDIRPAAQYPGHPFQAEHKAYLGGLSRARGRHQPWPPLQTASRQGVDAATQEPGHVYSGEERRQVGENLLRLLLCITLTVMPSPTAQYVRSISKIWF